MLEQRKMAESKRLLECHAPWHAASIMTKKMWHCILGAGGGGGKKNGRGKGLA